MTAAPSTIWLSGSWSRPRSDSTRAVIPTDVAVERRAGDDRLEVRQPQVDAARYPRRNGAATPTTATSDDAAPTRSRRLQVRLEADLEQRAG